ncbi:MAG: pyridoxal phosphate-dependent aminotransferase [Candidatus Thermoplasmatota archaeon]|nr:pyridoxal phosphate-dependent aminotransferase [Candidatus Thermoplasmatota archaeon]
MVSSRLSNISQSATISMNLKAEELRKTGKKVYNFSLGEPDFNTPDNIIDFAFKAARNGKTHYTPSKGVLELREKIARKFKEMNNISADPANIIVTPTKFSVSLAIMSLLEEGDNVLLPMPYYVSYPDIVKLYGGVPRGVKTNADYSFDYEALEKAVDGKTKALIFSNPCNPTGKVYGENEIRNLCDFVIEHGLYLISDEIYEDLSFEKRPFSPASIPEMADKTITLSGFSKSYAMTGWRIGYMLANPEIIRASDIIQQQTMTCATSVSQYAAIAALDDRETPRRFRDAFMKRRDLIMKSLSGIDGLSFVKPEGAFYLFPEYDLEMTSNDMSMKLLEDVQVIVTPGSAFGEQGEKHFRISYATSDENIIEGSRKIGEFMHRGR